MNRTVLVFFAPSLLRTSAAERPTALNAIGLV